MIVAYIRPDKNFYAVHEQLQHINSYATANDFVIDEEFIDHISQNKRLSERTHVTSFFQPKPTMKLLVYDVWVLSTNMEDLVQMFSCLMKNDFSVHFVKQSVTITKDSNLMLVCGLLDQFRQTLQNKSKKVIGRPKGSKSNSKFDKHISVIVAYIKEGKSVSDMARALEVSRSSLKDYIESRELKQVAFDSLLPTISLDAEEQVINTIICPD